VQHRLGVARGLLASLEHQIARRLERYLREEPAVVFYKKGRVRMDLSFFEAERHSHERRDSDRSTQLLGKSRTPKI